MKKNVELSENMEDYLEVILDLEKTQKVARAKDIAARLNIQRGSVTGGLKNLEKKGLINYEPYSFITLTPKGNLIAKEITRRHRILSDFFSNVLQVDANTADATACRMEHAIDALTMERLVRFIDYIYTCPRTGPEWIQNFNRHCLVQGHEHKTCKLCVEECNLKFQNE